MPWLLVTAASTPSTLYKETLLRETREELAKADGKASILLAASGIGFSAVLSVGSASHWYPDRLTHHAARLLAWASMGLILLGISVVAAAVKPRLRASHDTQPPRLHYFGDVDAYWPRWWRVLGRRKALDSGRQRFGKALELSATAEEYSERLTDQIWHLSHIAYRKYRLVSVSIWLYGFALALALTALVVEKEWL